MKIRTIILRRRLESLLSDKKTAWSSAREAGGGGFCAGPRAGRKLAALRVAGLSTPSTKHMDTVSSPCTRISPGPCPGPCSCSKPPGSAERTRARGCCCCCCCCAASEVSHSGSPVNADSPVHVDVSSRPSSGTGANGVLRVRLEKTTCANEHEHIYVRASSL